MRRQCENGGKDWSEVATNQEKPAPPRIGKRQGLDSLRAGGRHCNALTGPKDNWFQTSRLENGKRIISLVLSHPVCGNVLHQPQETNIASLLLLLSLSLL